MTDSKPEILVIDDTPLNLAFLKAALAKDFSVRTATSGALGCEMALQTTPDIILLDIMMPEMDGFETFALLRSHASLLHVPVVFVTGETQSESEIKGLDLGAADYITKPIRVQIARRRIWNLLERERLHKVVRAQKLLLESQVAQLEVAQRELQESEERYRSLVDTSPNAIVVHRDGVLVYCNPAAVALIGADSADDLIGRDGIEFLHPDYRKMVQERVKLGTDRGLTLPMVEEKYVKFDGSEIDVEVLATPIVFDGKPAVRLSLRDITMLKAHQSKIEHLAHFDALTNLPNRVLLADRLRQGMVQAQRRSQKLAIAYLDLDGFKWINDNHCHDA
jgi:PAS domain S-box-containing protein